ncbi:TlpA disulfide reductase family protein [Parvularcula maris]|uniref:TlpA family protein disulfide reductase n=1 Tax=Parvularcula maris TaxID=2965077 RepID=A0A9X2LAW4_9PROT|nr:TlpA disulfide reductase family protein [Parvularcula maris]MCQ8186351.1 TlpA family protein disulfide reductase [Parvularcula maris]
MPRIDAYTLMKILAGIGGLALVFVLLSSMGGKPKPWEADSPRYIVGEMASFERSFPSAPLPEVTLETPEGQVSLSQMAAGKVLVLNLWATWCAPCVEELPSLAALQEELGDDYLVLAAAQEGGDGSRQRAMLERIGAEELGVALDPKLALSRALGDGRLTLPVTAIYDARGRRIGVLRRPADWSSPEAVRLVRTIGAGELPR